jgi:hypothetical protein
MEKNEKHMILVSVLLVSLGIIGISVFLSRGYGLEDISGSAIYVMERISGRAVIEEVSLPEEQGIRFSDNRDISREDALEALIEGEKIVNELEGENFSIYYFRDLLLEAKKAFIGYNRFPLENDIAKREEGEKKEYLKGLLELYDSLPPYDYEVLNYTETYNLVQAIKARRERLYNILDSISLIEEKERDYKERGINTSEALIFLERAKEAFNLERYEEAESYLDKADSELEKARIEQQRIRGLINLGKGFFEKYWLHIVLVVGFLIGISPFVWKETRKILAKRKLDRFRDELNAIESLIRKAQEDYLVKQVISRDVYLARVEKYRDRMMELRRTIPVLSAIARGEKPKKERKEKVEAIIKVER